LTDRVTGNQSGAVAEDLPTERPGVQRDRPPAGHAVTASAGRPSIDPDADPPQRAAEPGADPPRPTRADPDAAPPTRAAGDLGARRRTAARDPGSYRDPSGFIFRRDGVVLRQVNRRFAADWDAFTAGGLGARLVERGRLLPWTDVPLDQRFDDEAHAVIRPERLDLVSYPYEWTFGQLRDAALLTLDAELAAMDAGLTLKDASAYNVQFRGATPVLIDHLSFERAIPDAPWIAYRQFCEHFLAPLALMAERDVRCGLMLRDHVDGIPLDLAATLLPGRSRLNLGLGTHLHLHARAQRQHAGDSAGDGHAPSQPRLPASRLRALVESLRSTISGLHWNPGGTEWAGYADMDHPGYSDGPVAGKAQAVGAMLAAVGGQTCWDLGANTGRYSRIAADAGYRVVALDVDPGAAERHYRALAAEHDRAITPLVVDLADPSPPLGWAGRERLGLLERADADVVLALALIHHLAIGRNVPLPMIADLFAQLAPHAIVEWVPRSDPLVRRLLSSRVDIFDRYTEDGFREAVEARFEVGERVPIEGSERVLYRLARRD